MAPAAPAVPVVRSGRAAVGVLAIVGISASGAFGHGGSHLLDWVLAALVGSGPWSTGWSPAGSWTGPRCGSRPACCAATPGSCRWRASRPWTWCARSWPAPLGLAELRVRLAGSSHADGRLAYLPEQAALDLRARLLAAHHGLDPATPEPAEQILATVPNGRLVGSVLASGGQPARRAAGGGSRRDPGLARGARRRREHAPDLPAHPWCRWRGGGWRPSTGSPWPRRRTASGSAGACCGTVAETIPLRRVQAVRMVEPVLWRPLGWCRLEIDVAGPRAGTTPTGRAGCARPCCRSATARWPAAYADGIGAAPPPLSRPPRRARRKAPLSYHFLAAGHDAATAMGVTGRLPKRSPPGCRWRRCRASGWYRAGPARPVPGHRARGRGGPGGPGGVPGPARRGGGPPGRGTGRALPERPAPGQPGQPGQREVARAARAAQGRARLAAPARPPGQRR